MAQKLRDIDVLKNIQEKIKRIRDIEDEISQIQSIIDKEKTRLQMETVCAVEPVCHKEELLAKFKKESIASKALALNLISIGGTLVCLLLFVWAVLNLDAMPGSVMDFPFNSSEFEILVTIFLICYGILGLWISSKPLRVRIKLGKEKKKLVWLIVISIILGVQVGLYVIAILFIGFCSFPISAIVLPIALVISIVASKVCQMIYNKQNDYTPAQLEAIAEAERLDEETEAANQQKRIETDYRVRELHEEQTVEYRQRIEELRAERKACEESMKGVSVLGPDDWYDETINYMIKMLEAERATDIAEALWLFNEKKEREHQDILKAMKDSMQLYDRKQGELDSDRLKEKAKAKH